MTIDPANFLHSFCRHLVARAAAATPAVTIEYLSTPRALFRGVAVETGAAETYTVVRITGGAGTNWDPLPRLSLQVMTVAKAGLETALSRAQTLFEALSDSDGHPARMVTINGYKAADNTADGTWRLVSIDPLQRPSPIGPDANRREQVVFNVDVGVVKLT